MNNNLRKNIESIQNEGVGKTNTFNFSSVQIRTMPKGFKRSLISNNSDSVKKTGFIILITGSLFLFLVLGAAYYYFIAGPNSGKTNQAPVANELENVNNQAVVVPPKEEDLASVDEDKVTEEQENDYLDKRMEDYLEDKDELTEGDEQNIDTELEESAESKSQTAESRLSIIIDKDGDSLSLEEEQVSGTSDDLVDTDEDGYSDLAEMLNGYNPTGDGFLVDSPYFREYVNNPNNFSFVYPKSFKTTASSSDIIIFDLQNGEFFQIFVEKNEDNLSLENWYKNVHNISLVDDSQKSQKGEWSVIRNINNQTIFFKNDKNNYVVALNYSSNEGVLYANMLEIIFNSFKSLN